jgi:hypothetical protein
MASSAVVLTLLLAASAPAATTRVSYNRNALSDSLVDGDSVLVLTRAGTLLRFSLPDVVLTGEYSGRSPITCIGTRSGVIVAGAEDGAVFKVDLAAMTLTSVASVKERPVWVSTQWAVTEGKEHRRRQEEGGMWEYDATVLTVRQLPRGKSYRLEGEFNGDVAFFQDGSTLWIALDEGEFGARTGTLDLERGEQRWSDTRAVTGFATLGGESFAWGGGMHIVLSSAFIAKLGEDRLQTVYELDNFDPDYPHWEPPDDRPVLPISAIVPDATPGHLLVFCYSRVFRVDRDFSRWSEAATLELSYEAGRANAVGYYPAIVRVHPLRGGRYLVVTKLDGLKVFSEGKVVSKALSNQPCASRFDDIVPFGSHTALVDTMRPLAQYLDGERWTNIAPVSEDAGCWFGPTVTPGVADSLLIVPSACNDRESRRLLRWRDGQVDTLCEWTGPVGDVVTTPDGLLWHFTGNRIEILSGNGWMEAGDCDGLDSIRVVSEAGPPWLLMDRLLTPERIEHRLQRLWYERDGVPASVGDLAVAGLRDAVPLSPFRTLVLTDAGLRILDARSLVWSKSDVPVPSRGIRKLARDRQGRIWMGGDGLWVVDGGAVTDVGAALSTTGSDVIALAADPISDGIYVLLDRGMIVHVEAGSWGQASYPK